MDTRPTFSVPPRPDRVPPGIVDEDADPLEGLRRRLARMDTLMTLLEADLDRQREALSALVMPPAELAPWGSASPPPDAGPDQEADPTCTEPAAAGAGRAGDMRAPSDAGRPPGWNRPGGGFRPVPPRPAGRGGWRGAGRRSGSR